MPAKAVALAVVPAFNHEASACEVTRILRGMSSDEILAECRETVKAYTEAEGALSSAFKRLALLFCALKKRDENFKPWRDLSDLSHGALSNASQAVPLALLFIEGSLPLELWRALSFADILELRRTGLNEDLLVKAAVVRSKHRGLGSEYLVACAQTDDPEGWASRALEEQLTPKEISKSAQGKEIWHDRTTALRIFGPIFTRVRNSFSQWLTLQGGIKAVEKWDLERCLSVLKDMDNILAFAKILQSRIEKVKAAAKIDKRQ